MSTSGSTDCGTVNGSNASETKVIYHVDDEETPYLIKIPVPGNAVTLGVLKTALNKINCKYFIKTMDEELGMVVKEEVHDDNSLLPLSSGRIVVYINQVEGSHGGSDNASQYTESAVNDNWPPGRNDLGGHYNPEDDYSVTETESCAPLPNERRPADRRIPNSARYPPYDKGYESSTTAMSQTDYESQSFMESTDDDESVIRGLPPGQHMGPRPGYRDYQRRPHRRRPRRTAQAYGGRRMPGKPPSVSSVTDSTMSLNIIVVNITMDSTKFLGISIVGQSTHDKGDGGIYVGEIMPGGAVHQDGQIEPGDLILQVNDISFDNMTNDEAVRILREAVNKPGPLKLVVAKYWNPHPGTTGSYFTIPKNEPLDPIDPAQWVEASRNYTMNGAALSPVTMNSGGSSASLSDSNFTYYQPAALPNTDGGPDGNNGEYKALSSADPIAILRAMQHPDSGLEIKDRMWLKITIPKAFLGMNLVDWLYDHVGGFNDRRESKNFAKKLLKDGYLKHTTGKSTFSEQCYYVFNQDKIDGGSSMGTLTTLQTNTLDGAKYHGGPEHMEDEEKDVLSPLPYQTPWGLATPQYTGYQPPQRYNMGMQLDSFGPPQQQGYAPVNNQQQMMSQQQPMSMISMPLLPPPMPMPQATSTPQQPSQFMQQGGVGGIDNAACNSPSMGQQRKDFINPFRTTVGNGESVFANVM